MASTQKKITSIEKETETLNSSMLELLIEGRRTLSWACGMMKVDGVMRRTVSQLLH